MTQPIGWSSSRVSQHYKTALPIFSDTREYLNVHRNITRQLPPREAVYAIPKNVALARNILHRQRMEIRSYSGSQLSHKDQENLNLSKHLHHPSHFQPFYRQGTFADKVKQLSETYVYQNTDSQSQYRDYQSNTEPSLRGIGAGRHSKDQLPPIKVAIPPCTAASRYTPDDVNRIVDRFSMYDPEKFPDSNGYSIKLLTSIVYKKKYSDEEIQAIFKRLTINDLMKGSVESYGTAPACVASVPRQTLAKIKKCSAEEVQKIVERLCRFDISQCPPESKLTTRSVP
ncbi:hypothetical protein CHS0354_036246 [Potamilus streckersoni]|uniref:Uncharacterized protein n=1 Tax=Potamilus streckersoni TaxID=2493646 RepID=A0AAE0SVY5_9BIVA|nr:hypothetical protein CHS0354_036246 [Potamilus streckersoni]